MNRFAGRVERRLFQAVLLVVAGGCETTAPPGPQHPVETVARDAAPADQVVHVDPAPTDAAHAFAVPPPDAGIESPADAGVVAAAPDAGVVAAAPDADKICAAHATRRGALRTQSAYWDPTTHVVMCWTVHADKPAKVEVMYHPHWCPQGGGQRPEPYPVTVDGRALLVEEARLTLDGKVTKSKKSWQKHGALPEERRHNCGRRTDGVTVTGARPDEHTAIGAQLAEMAELEAASVPAFARLARELEAHGAPAELVRRAEAARGDEVRHARVMTALAHRHGRTPRAVAVPALPCRTLDAIAYENAVEGCVREAYGALVATFMAARARPELRRVFRAIARDERRHAELAEDIDAWIRGRLDAAACAALDAARAGAEAELRAGVATSPACDELGLPGPDDAQALCHAYFGSRTADDATPATA